MTSTTSALSAIAAIPGKGIDSIKMEMQISWHGPYASYGFGRLTGLPELPTTTGVYLQTIPWTGDYRTIAPGISIKQNFRKRGSQHNYATRCGRYNVLNPSALLEGRGELLWQGWGKWTDERATAFRARPDLLEAALQMMAAYRMFVTEITDERLALRLEAAIIQEIEKDPTRLADDGMHKCPRRDTEDPITIWNTCESKLHGLPETLSI